MKVVKIHIASTRGTNNMASGGHVWFDDGKDYGWGRDHQDHTKFSFNTTRKLAAGNHIFFPFHSALREKALRVHLDG